MKRYLIGQYAAATLEIVAGFFLTWGGIDLVRHVSLEWTPDAEDLLVATAFGPPGVSILLAGITAMLARKIPIGIVRDTRIAALSSEVWMILAGIGIYVHTKRVGGDWAGIGYLAATVFIVSGGLLLLVSWLGLRFLRRGWHSQSATPN